MSYKVFLKKMKIAFKIFQDLIIPKKKKEERGEKEEEGEEKRKRKRKEKKKGH